MNYDSPEIPKRTYPRPCVGLTDSELMLGYHRSDEMKRQARDAKRQEKLTEIAMISQAILEQSDKEDLMSSVERCAWRIEREELTRRKDELEREVYPTKAASA